MHTGPWVPAHLQAAVGFEASAHTSHVLQRPQMDWFTEDLSCQQFRFYMIQP